MEKKTFYITTPIYYPSDKLHIGHTYCTVATDAIARYKRLQGYDVMFLTGTDEHGQKIETKAEEAGMTPQAFVDRIVEGERGVLDLWKLMNISNDRFIRTTDDYHCAAVQKIFKKMYDNGDIYKGAYKGKYCTPCESFWTESQLVDGKCPDCGREVHDAEEEAYFFRLSKYADRVQHLLEDTDFLQPRIRVNEMVNNFIKPGLEDLCVSRTSFKWGIPVDFDPGHVVYVWVDALFNYCTALGFDNDRYDDYDKYWPADYHIVGKEIVRFHSIIWPAMLMSMGMPLPKHVYGHGWLVMDGGKMSKSKGEFLTVSLLEEKGYDPLSYRFFCLQSHYRKSLVFSWENLDNATVAYNKLLTRIAALKDEGEVEQAAFDEYKAKFTAAMDNDLNTSMAVTVLYDVLKAKTNDKTKLALLDSFDTVLGLKLLEKAAALRAKQTAAPVAGVFTVISESGETDGEVEALIRARADAKKAKNFTEADRIRDELKAKGINVGLVRPITVWPFPYDAVHEACCQPSVKAVLDVELNEGQMLEDVKLAISGAKHVDFFGHCGSQMPSTTEIVEKILSMKEGK